MISQQQYALALVLVVNVASAIQLEQQQMGLVPPQPALEGLLAQTDSETLADDDCPCHSGLSYGLDPYSTGCGCGSSSDTDYYCPPALGECPGVAQPPGPCIEALKCRPLCYSNTGHMNTEWYHKVDVDKSSCSGGYGSGDCGYGAAPVHDYSGTSPEYDGAYDYSHLTDYMPGPPSYHDDLYYDAAAEAPEETTADDATNTATTTEPTPPTGGFSLSTSPSTTTSSTTTTSSPLTTTPSYNYGATSTPTTSTYASSPYSYSMSTTP